MIDFEIQLTCFFDYYLTRALVKYHLVENEGYLQHYFIVLLLGYIKNIIIKNIN
jgi:hypothetical protein